MTDKADYKRKIERLEALLVEEQNNTKMLLALVREQITTLELQRMMLKKCEKAQND